MAKQFWVRSGHEVRGPFSVDDLQQFARDGKLKPGHKLSPDRRRWQRAGSVRGLTFPAAAPAGAHGGETGAVGMAAHRATDAARKPALVAGGAALLVGSYLLVGGAAAMRLGLLGGAVALALFTLALGLGYAAVTIGREMTAIYALLVVAAMAVLFGQSDAATGLAIPVWAAFLGGAVLAAVVVTGCRLLSLGSGHDYTAPGGHQQDLIGFDAAPVRGRDAQRLLAATNDPASADGPSRVRLRLDPDDLARTEPTLTEAFEGEVKRGSPALAVSLAVHAVLLLGLWFIKAAVTEEEQLVLQGGWISEREQTEVADKPNTPVPVELQGLDFSRAQPRDSAAPADPADAPPLRPLGDEPGDGTAAKPVDVGGLFDGRSDGNRRRLLANVDGGEQVDSAVAAGLRWLLRQQQEAGNWQLDDGYPDPSERVLKTDTGATALALLALLGNGQTHVHADDEATRAAVEKGINWLLGVQKANGDFHDWDELGRQTAYYAHSQAVIAVCEAYAMTGDRRLIEPAQRGVDFLLKSQQPKQGGWKYQPQDEHSVGDLSVTGWALMALHTARAAGLHVPQEPFQRGMTFLDLVQSEGGARYRYEPRPGWDPTPAMTAEGLLCRQYLGWRDDHPALQSGVDYLLGPANEPTWEAGKRNVYAWYYTGQVLHNLGDERFARWYGRAAAEIVGHQVTSGRGDIRGSWHPSRPAGAHYEYATKAGRLYFTAMCLLVLETPYRHRAVTP